MADKSVKHIATIIMVLLATAVSAEPWYYYEPNDIVFQTPDKVQHYWGSYVLAEFISAEQTFIVGVIWEMKQKMQGGEFGEKDLLLDLLGSYQIGYVIWNVRDSRWLFVMNVKF